MYIITVTPSSMFVLYILVLVFNVQSYWHIKKDLFTLFLCISFSKFVLQTLTYYLPIFLAEITLNIVG